MNVMVTGGCGNIGRIVVERLAQRHDVTVVDRVAPPASAPGRAVTLDLTSSDELDRVDGAFEAIVHLAAIPNPYVAPWGEVLRVNMLTTFNVLRFAAERGVPRVVFGSSESASGWGIHGRFYRPDYLPIDERHRSLPSEVYSYTKAFGDQLCQGFSREHGLQTVCLRYTFVAFDATYDGFLRQVAAAPVREALGATYAWIDVEDVAQAVGLSLDLGMESEQSETFYLTAAKHYGTLSTIELIRRNWGDDIKVDLGYYDEEPYGSLFDLRKARTMLGWEPKWDLDRVMAAYGPSERSMQ